MSSLQELDLFHIKPLVSEFHSKLSAISENDSPRQILCLVSEDNDILLRYKNELGPDALKVIHWFKGSGRVIHDICFDPTGTWLMILCFDNTLHIIPALKIVDKNVQISEVFAADKMTSFVIPFVGPHECPNSKNCPNNDLTALSSPFKIINVQNITEGVDDYSATTQAISVPTVGDRVECANFPYSVFERTRLSSSLETSSSHRSSDLGARTSSTQTNESAESFLSSSTCPYPLSAVWWLTMDGKNRAIIGYSDGSICFVALTPNCPFIANTSIENGAVIKLHICQDNSRENVTLLVNSSIKHQWKLLLEQKSINYTFPGDISPTAPHGIDLGREDWQFVMPVKTNSRSVDSEKTDGSPKKGDLDSPTRTAGGNMKNGNSKQDQKSVDSDESVSSGAKSGILPAAKARFASLKDLGTRKFSALRAKLIDGKFKPDENDSLSSFAIMESPAMTPEILTTPPGPFFIVQNLRNTYLLSALHHYSDTLSVHSMDISLIPLFLYKIPKNCQDVLISSNILYTVQLVEEESKDGDGTKLMENSVEILKQEGQEEREENAVEGEKRLVNAIGVISSAIASIKNGEETEFNQDALLNVFKFPADETIVNIHRMGTFLPADKRKSANTQPPAEYDSATARENKKASNYVRLYRDLEKSMDFESQREMQIMQDAFPKFNFDPCIVVTNRSTYFIEFRDKPAALFVEAAVAGRWAICEDFCNTFDLTFAHCIEFAGDYLLKKKKVTQALLTYNIARIPPVRTALKLAMHGENCALMHLCAMALKVIFILKSKYPISSCIKYLFPDARYRHSEDAEANVLNKMICDRKTTINEGKSCRDYTYGEDEAVGNLQMTASSQFHLSNLLVITLSERAVREKDYMPVWNFLVSNTKYHTNMTSIVLCQSGLYSGALLLALSRGACFDVFMAMVGVSNQEFGKYSELNTLLYNTSERLFAETIAYLRPVAIDYFIMLQSKIKKLARNVLERLEIQLCPFYAVYRPIISTTAARNAEDAEGHSNELFDFSKYLIETYLAVLMQLEVQNSGQDNIINALNNFQINYEDNQFAIKSSNFIPISAGCTHSACIVDGTAYFWGSNGISSIYSSTKATDNPDPPHVVKPLDLIAQLNLEVHAIECGRQHSLVLTNNGLYAFGSNQLGQLGIGEYMQVSLHPMLVEGLDNKNITVLAAGQYHSAAVADGDLYTWGWGVYGQLGHGNIENAYHPTRLEFFHVFHKKTVVQVSLGHAHSLVLCKDANGSQLFVFGSNHFGQLGQHNSDESSSLTKSLVPVLLDIENENIRLIRTKFFTNLAVTDSNHIYTWGSSPQALRLANQIKRRANAKQKLEDGLKKELNRRIEIESKENRKSDEPNKTSSEKIVNEETARLKKSSSSSLLEFKTADEKLSRRHSEPKEIDSIGQKSGLPDVREVEMKVLRRRDSDLPEIKIETIEIEPGIKPDEEATTSSKRQTLEEDANEHLHPHLVDTTEVSGVILQVATGLFHFSLISSTSVMYTWGKNLEHQLGTEDRDRRGVLKPTALECIENPMYVDCGADFTIVMTKDYVVKAFGGNANGQCGRELAPVSDKTSRLPGKFFCLPTTKRIMRLDGHCIESPVNINLPRPRIQMTSEPTRYLKSFPKFKPWYTIRSNVWRDSECGSKVLGEAVIFDTDERDDSSVENVSFINEESIGSTGLHLPCLSSYDASPNDEHFPEKDDRFAGGHMSNASNSRTHFRQYIHYCLYIFHGLYDPHRVNSLSCSSPEFHIRTLMLGYQYVDAFKMCLTECLSAQKSLKIFEYFTKDPNIVPMRRDDLKIFIYQIFTHFLQQNFDIMECEKFFLADLDYYLRELSFVLYFNNNNTELEQCLNRKYRDVYQQSVSDDTGKFNFDDTTAIFDSLSVKFKAIICQKIMKLCDG